MAETKPTKVARWATNADRTLEPSSGEKNVGWEVQKKPPARFMNWLHNIAYKWFAWLNERVFDGATAADFVVQGVDAGAGTDLDGGDLTVSGGQATGDGGAEILIKVVEESQGAGTTIRNPTQVGKVSKTSKKLEMSEGIKGTGGTDQPGVEGVGGSSSGPGVKGSGTAGNAIGVEGVGQGSAQGVKGTGGATGIGVEGAGGGSASGVKGTGGATGAGIEGVGGSSSGVGVKGAGTAGNAIGVEGVGQGVGPGVKGTGGASSADGVYGIGGNANGIGVHGLGQGTGAGGRFVAANNGHGVIAEADTTTPVKSALRLVPQDTAPSSPVEGDVYVNSATHKMEVYLDGAWRVAATS